MTSRCDERARPVWPRRRWLLSAGLGLGLGMWHWRAVGAEAAQGADGTARAVPALLLARDHHPGIDVPRYLVSEKFDGVRALWDGRRLRFRGGGEVPAPAWFLQRLPGVPLDGELWLGRGRFEALAGIVRTERPVDADWRQVQYRVFELPGGEGDFAQRAARLQSLAAEAGWPQLVAVAQARVADPAALQRRLDAVLRDGGEGLVLHRADAAYVTGRSDVLLKLKPVQDAEAVVIGHVPGKGRHAGRLGALRVRGDDGRVFQIGTGLRDAERDQPPPLGATVSYRFRGTTASGLPRFASYWRQRAEP